ncbi:hypothetical protein OGAPHI_005766 [Ogataea philodendri]|uniref:NADP-dependent oxidoreductase domain-containing protein n=1 Tax=Ogataea philodendri TaxID=1378263 RepID=A0A9P8NZV4_9ASCO|nr:uncharacterized protein OGAPHI_005766 [Ogataea philodendri]KAH3662514.1 hypothetical protein OGAPHI_005766 [Ogataea philodendri]
MSVLLKGETGYGLMSLTWRPTPVPREQAFATINNAISEGIEVFNSGEFYGNFPNDKHANLELLKAYFEEYPDSRSKMVISVKGCIDIPNPPDNSPENVAKSIRNIASYFPGKKFDIFEPARMDTKHAVEDVVKSIIPFVEDGTIRGISLSEVGADTIRRAAKVHPISCVEVEFSLWTRDILTNGVMDTCRELGIPVVAYSPLGRGYLTGQIKSVKDIPAGDIRHHLDRFASEEALARNMGMVKLVEQLAAQKKCTPAQIALAWVRKHSEFPEKYARVIPIPSSSTPERNHENNTLVKLTDGEFATLNEQLAKITVSGLRYNAHAEAFLEK